MGSNARRHAPPTTNTNTATTSGAEYFFLADFILQRCRSKQKPKVSRRGGGKREIRAGRQGCDRTIDTLNKISSKREKKIKEGRVDTHTHTHTHTHTKRKQKTALSFLHPHWMGERKIWPVSGQSQPVAPSLAAPFRQRPLDVFRTGATAADESRRLSTNQRSSPPGFNQPNSRTPYHPTPPLSPTFTFDHQSFSP